MGNERDREREDVVRGGRGNVEGPELEDQISVRHELSELTNWGIGTGLGDVA